MKRLFALFGSWFIFVLLIQVLALWVAGSVITSVVKAGTKSCGQRYLVEEVFSGDWFCSVKE